MKSNAYIAAETLTQILATGARNFIICAGARNAPLVVPLLKLDGQDGIKIWHHFDERAAAFFAVGLAKRQLDPVCVITTSGTAVAELLPATIEAYYSGIPLILLTADRPERFRGSGAPQAIEQAGIFGPYAETEIENWNHQAPLHLNLCFEEPLLDGEAEIKIPRPDSLPSISPAPPLSISPSLVLVGELLEAEREPVTTFLRKTQYPVWCEATSGLRETAGLNHLRGGDFTIAELEDITRVLRIGGVPSLRFWRDLETRDDIEVTSISRTGFPGLARKHNVTTQQCLVDDSTLLSQKEQTEGPHTDRDDPSSQHGPLQSSTTKTLISRPALTPPIEGPEGKKTSRGPCSDEGSSRSRSGRILLTREEQAIHDLSERIPSDALVFLGNSLPIREWNLAATTAIPHPHVFANRGANGIDGEISTFLGLAQDSAAEECWGIFGDLTTLYDLNAPWICDQLDSGKQIRIVVINNGGGRIFSKLPGLRDLPDTEKRITENWHGFDFAKWAELWPSVEIEMIDVRDRSMIADTEHNEK